MDHLVIPLDRNHTEPVDELAQGVAAAIGVTKVESVDPHITLIAHSGISAAAVRKAISPVVAATEPFAVHAHGYGFFTGDEPSDLSLHVPVARTPALSNLHRQLSAALRRAGADLAGWSASAFWSPHITLLDRCLAPESLGRAVEWLAQRHHPSWEVPVDRVTLLGGWPDRGQPAEVVCFGAGTAGAPFPDDNP